MINQTALTSSDEQSPKDRQSGSSRLDRASKEIASANKSTDRTDRSGTSTTKSSLAKKSTSDSDNKDAHHKVGEPYTPLQDSSENNLEKRSYAVTSSLFSCHFISLGTAGTVGNERNPGTSNSGHKIFSLRPRPTQPLSVLY